MAKDGQITIDLTGIIDRLREKNADDPEILAKLDAFAAREPKDRKLPALLRLVKPEDTENDAARVHRERVEECQRGRDDEGDE